MESHKIKALIALNLIYDVGPSFIRKLIKHFGSPEIALNSNINDFRMIEGVSIKLCKLIIKNRKKVIEKAEEIYLNLLKYEDIKILPFYHETFPSMLNNFDDAPILLFFKGNFDFNFPRKISIVGSRGMTNYGKDFIEELFLELKKWNVSIISGLAYGVDIESHKRAIENNIPNVAVLGSGINLIYPVEHKIYQNDICKNGGFLSEYLPDAKPETYHFPERNRIIAGLCNALIVVETQLKGGAMITANIANSYSKDVLALPGDYNKPFSKGCNYLIMNNLATCISSVEDIPKLLNWDVEKNNLNKTHKFAITKILNELSDEKKIILKVLSENQRIHIDELVLKTNIPLANLTNLVFELECDDIINIEPGKFYKLKI